MRLLGFGTTVGSIETRNNDVDPRRFKLLYK